MLTVRARFEGFGRGYVKFCVPVCSPGKRITISECGSSAVCGLSSGELHPGSLDSDELLGTPQNVCSANAHEWLQHWAGSVRSCMVVSVLSYAWCFSRNLHESVQNLSNTPKSQLAPKTKLATYIYITRRYKQKLVHLYIGLLLRAMVNM